MSKERSNWRDEELSKFHRYLDERFHLENIDSLWIEASGEKPAAVIEYKNERAGKNGDEKMKRQLSLYANTVQKDVPIFGIKYASDMHWFEIHPWNAAAKKFVPLTRQFTMIEYVKLLYNLRGIVAPSEIDMITNIGWNAAGDET